MKSKPIRAILSDAGGILFDDTFGKRIEFEFLASRTSIDYEDFKHGFYPFKVRAQTEPSYTRDQALKDYLTSIGREELFPEFASYRDAQLQHAPAPCETVKEGVIPALARLTQSGIEIVVITDATSDREKSDRFYTDAGLRPYLKDRVSSKDIGVKKPHPRFYETALARNGLQQDEVVVVAHDYDEIEGALRLGFKVVAVGCTPVVEERIRGTIDAAYILRSFSELPEIPELKEKCH